MFIKKQALSLFFLSFIGVLLSSPSHVLATCGSFFGNQPAGQQCIDATNNSAVNPNVVCTSNAAVCCSTAAECPGAGQPTPTLPANSGYQESSQNCGSWANDPGLNRQVCLDGETKILSNAISCPRAPQCCREPGNCSVYWACNPTNHSCVQDPYGAYTDQSSCDSGCRVTPTPAPQSTVPPAFTPDPVQQYEPSANSLFLYRVNPLTVTGNSNPFFGFVQGVLNLGTFSTPAGFMNALLVFLFPLAGMILFIMIVWGGFEMVMGAADPKAQEAGKHRVTAALIGFTLLFISYWIVQIIQQIFGLNILR